MIKVINKNNIKVLRKIPDNYFHSVVTDPPYHIGFMGKQWDHISDKNSKIGIAFDIEFWKEILRVLRPGGYCLAFAAAKLDHRIAVAIEDAGFIIRNKIMWMYGSGFPKGLNIAKGIDKKERGCDQGKSDPKSKNHKGWKLKETIREQDRSGAGASSWVKSTDTNNVEEIVYSSSAQEWDGWNTEIKPAYEPIIMAQKPISEKTIVDNVLKWGTGGINIDACRIPLTGKTDPRLGGKGTWKTGKMAKNVYAGGYNGEIVGSSKEGRHPANVIHDGSDEVEEVFALFGEKKSGKPGKRRKNHTTNSMSGTLNTTGKIEVGFGDSGSVSRFFYCAKVSTKERAGAKHPTVKPLSLKRYLVKLVTPKKGRVLDPFLGSGTTAIACELEDFSCIGIEKDEDSYKEYFIRRKVLIPTKKSFHFSTKRRKLRK